MKNVLRFNTLVAALVVTLVTACSPSTNAAAPAAPTNLVATPLDSAVRITFDEPDDGGRPITNYEVSLDGGTSFEPLDPEATASPIEVPGLTNDTEYVLALRAVNDVGVGPASTTVVATPRSAAMILLLTVTQGDVDVGKDTLTLPLYGTYDVTIDWGDGSPSTDHADSDASRPTHTYAGPGSYDVSITGSVQRFGVDAADEASGPQLGSSLVTAVTTWGTLGLESLANAFEGFTGLTQLPTWFPSTVKNTSFMFYNASGFNQDLDGWDTSNVTDMRAMFHLAPTFDGDVSNWDTSSVSDMSLMFAGSAFDQPIGDWDTGNVTSMVGVFSYSPFNQPIGTWNTSNVAAMDFMFDGAATFDQPIGTWDTGKATDMNRMFRGASSFNQDLSEWTPGCAVEGRTTIIDQPTDFDASADNWTLAVADSRPDWGAACTP